MKEIKEVEPLPTEHILRREKEKSIQELCNDPIVIQVMKQFHLNKTDVEEYWVDFLNYRDDLNQCKNCLSIHDCPKVSKGMVRDFQYENHRVSLALTPCTYGKEQFENQHILNQVLLKNVSGALLLTKSSDLTMLKDDNGNAKNVASQLAKYIKVPAKKGFYLYGKPGCGKSTLMGWLIRSLVLNGNQCGFIHFPTFLMDLKNSFGEDGIYESIELMKNLEYLVIDDIGGESVTVWSRDEVLSSVLAYRAQNSKPTFFTSVYSLKELKKYYTLKNGDTLRVERLIDRMKAVSLEIELTGNDLR